MMELIPKLRVCYPQLNIPTDEVDMEAYILVWMDICGKLTDELFRQAVEVHFEGPNSKWPLTPPYIWACFRPLDDAERMIEDMMARKLARESQG